MSDPTEFSLPESAQRRNGLVFLTSMSLVYLIAPVTYVGVLQATILDSLKASAPVYYLNFIVSCSKPERMRENTAYTTLVTVTIGIMPILFVPVLFS